MRSTCCGARSGRSSIITFPSFSSRTSMFSRAPLPEVSPVAGALAAAASEPASSLMWFSPRLSCVGDAGADDAVRPLHHAAVAGTALDLVHGLHARDYAAPGGGLVGQAR